MSRTRNNQVYQSILRSQTNPFLSESQVKQLLENYRSRRQKSFQQCIFNPSQQPKNDSLDTLGSQQSAVEQPPRRESTVQISQHKDSSLTFMIANCLPGFKKLNRNLPVTSQPLVLESAPGKSFARRRLEYLPKMTSQIKASETRRTKIVIDLAEGGIQIEGNKIKIRYTKIIQDAETSQNIVFLNNRPDIWNNLNSQRPVVQQIIKQRIVEKQATTNVAKKDKVIPSFLNVTETTADLISQHKKQVQQKEEPIQEPPKTASDLPSTMSRLPDSTMPESHEPATNQQTLAIDIKQNSETRNPLESSILLHQPSVNPFTQSYTGPMTSIYQLINKQGGPRENRQTLQVRPPQLPRNVFDNPKSSSIFNSAQFQPGMFRQPQQQQQVLPNNNNAAFQGSSQPHSQDQAPSSSQNANNIHYQNFPNQPSDANNRSIGFFSKNDQNQVSQLGLGLGLNQVQAPKMTTSLNRNNKKGLPRAY